MIEKITDEIIALTVVVAGVGFAGWITFLSGAIPEFFAVGFGMVLVHYFQKQS